nr:hypothetical protein RVX_0166 [Nitratidesulfovibrio sp. HK-II]
MAHAAMRRVGAALCWSPQPDRGLSMPGSFRAPVKTTAP